MRGCLGHWDMLATSLACILWMPVVPMRQPVMSQVGKHRESVAHAEAMCHHVSPAEAKLALSGTSGLRPWNEQLMFDILLAKLATK